MTNSKERRLKQEITLSQYVKRINGVGIGAPGSLKNMLERSLGAGSFYLFWRYWNPIWGYYLATKVMHPVGRVLPSWCALIVTFMISGALHDLAVTLIKLRFTFFLTPWFTLMGLAVIGTQSLNISYRNFPWIARALFNIGCVVGCFFLTLLMEEVLQ